MNHNMAEVIDLWKTIKVKTEPQNVPQADSFARVGDLLSVY
jgi:hypothetical protein